MKVRTIGKTLFVFLLLAGILSWGCATNQGVKPSSMPQAQIKPSAQEVASYEKAEGIVVEVVGYAYMGDRDTLESVRARARYEALKRAVEKGSQIYLKSYARKDFGQLTQDLVEEVVSGTLKRVETMEEGFQGSRYMVKLKALVVPTDVDTMLAKYEAMKTKAVETAASGKQVPKSRPTISATIPPSYKKACFCNFPPIYTKRIFMVLLNTPHVTRVERISTGKSNCICYRLTYTGKYIVGLERYLEEKLPYSSTVPFRIIHSVDEKSIDVYFDAGFD